MRLSKASCLDCRNFPARARQQVQSPPFNELGGMSPLTWGKPVDQMWGIRELCTTFAANPQVSALPPHICRDHDVARFERRRHGPGRPVGPPERKTRLRVVDPEGGRAGISRSPASRRRAQARSTFSDARRLQAQCPLVPGFDLCPGCGRGRKGFHRRIGVFHKRGAWPAPREVSGVPLVGTRCRCPRTCIPDASSYYGDGLVRWVSCGPCLFCLPSKIDLNKYGGCSPAFPP